jgi:imidazoleglycerol-phosphate dehydratase
MTLHIHMMSGKNTHHIIEAIFKSVARALREAVSYDQAFSEEIPSSKGMI